MTAQTPVYGLKYIVEGEPLRDARPALEDNAKTIEAALLNGGIAPPEAQNLAVVAGRVTALESKVGTLESVVIVRGSLSITPVADATTTGHVAFPAGTFGAAPTVVATPVTGVPGSTVKGVGVLNVTVTGFDIVVYRTNTTSFPTNWIAIGPKP